MILARALEELFFPRACAACGGLLAEDGKAAIPFCDTCAVSINRILEEPACVRCGRPWRLLAGRTVACRLCRAHPPAWRHLAILGRYDGALRATVLAGKIGGRVEAVAWLADRLVARLTSLRESPPTYDLVVAVPSDHAWAAALADAMADRLGADRVDLVARVPGAARQGGLGRRARAENARRMLTLRRPARVQSVLMVDDVVTTGSTLEAAARLLQATGVLVVDAAAVARTP